MTQRDVTKCVFNPFREILHFGETSYRFQLKEDYEGTVARLRQEIASLRDSLISIGRENERARNANDGGTIKTNRDDTVLKPEDDPVADMTQQLISNREKIEMLSRQNDRLSKTLCRLREYRGQVTTNGSNK